MTRAAVLSTGLTVERARRGYNPITARSHEKVLSELKGSYAFDAIPTHSYAANSIWQILSTIAHNLMVSFQIDAGASRRPPTPKRPPLFELRRMATMRFEWICRAGLVQRPQARRASGELTANGS